MNEEDIKLSNLEKRVDKHDWVISNISKQLDAINETLKKLDDHIIQFNEFHAEYKFYSSELLKLQNQFNDLPKKYVTRVEFKPVRKLVYGTVGVTLTIVLSAIIYLVVK